MKHHSTINLDHKIKKYVDKLKSSNSLEESEKYSKKLKYYYGQKRFATDKSKQTGGGIDKSIQSLKDRANELENKIRDIKLKVV